MRVYLRHQRAAKVCSSGAREWFAFNGLDFRDYVRNGIEADVLRELDDPVSNKVLAAAEQEQADGKR